METSTAKIRRRLEKDGWYLDRHGAGHDIYRHPEIEGIVTLPRHTQVSPLVARSIARKAGWTD
ncbi:type II toxin-antitoxin system HicA family toxin [Rhizobium sp. LC145]|jgi:predicted RNA binding protein YcfA (HicA-like mRNA interferase family)|uniref:type II toxin-antitoxin system HicA family toxin n=1 Tax=Rhizobium sp. LC145 TaxID=1120688 RepID=UPI000A74B65C|nr:type II toxin-antitoxin system HicA family toxin [Rhizobium sp. LC145]TKT43380.1 type II toxin-antitoxin system HicA family toxin [Rhizobiaceae bacterium LC148]